MQSSTTAMFESRTSSSKLKASASYGVFSGASAESTSQGSETQNTDTEAQSEEHEYESSSGEKETENYIVDDILVEGGNQNIGSILSDKNRAGFKSEFKLWLESIPKYPKGYDFKFGEISELLNINFKSLLTENLQPCWNRPDLYDGEDCRRCRYNVTTKDDAGDSKTEVRSCSFKDMNDLEDMMSRKRLSLKRAINIYSKNQGRSTSEHQISPGNPSCEVKEADIHLVTYEEILKGQNYKIQFDLEKPIGQKIKEGSTFLVAFKEVETQDSGNVGRWMVNPGKDMMSGQLGGKVVADTNNLFVFIYGARFSYSSDRTGNYLQWTKEDCEFNKKHFHNLVGE